MSESNRAKERKCTCIQLLQLLLQMAYLRCCFRFILAVWLRLVPFVGSSVTLFLSGATGTASVSCLLRHAEGSRADCAIEQPNSLFLPLPFGVWCLALALPSSAIRACAESPLPPRHVLRGSFCGNGLQNRTKKRRPQPPTRTESEGPGPRCVAPSPAPLAHGQGWNSWGQLPSSTAEMGSRTPSHCTR